MPWFIEIEVRVGCSELKTTAYFWDVVCRRISARDDVDSTDSDERRCFGKVYARVPSFWRVVRCTRAPAETASVGHIAGVGLAYGCIDGFCQYR